MQLLLMVQLEEMVVLVLSDENALFPHTSQKPIPYTCYCSIEQPFLQASHNHHQIPNTYVHCSPKYPERVCLLLFIMEPSGEKCVLHATNKRPGSATLLQSLQGL